MKLPDKKERNDEVDGGIIFVRLGPILVKNSHKWLAIRISNFFVIDYKRRLHTIPTFPFINYLI